MDSTHQLSCLSSSVGRSNTRSDFNPLQDHSKSIVWHIHTHNHHIRNSISSCEMRVLAFRDYSDLGNDLWINSYYVHTLRYAVIVMSGCNSCKVILKQMMKLCVIYRGSLQQTYILMNGEYLEYQISRVGDSRIRTPHYSNQDTPLIRTPQYSNQDTSLIWILHKQLCYSRPLITSEYAGCCEHISVKTVPGDDGWTPTKTVSLRDCTTLVR